MALDGHVNCSSMVQNRGQNRASVLSACTGGQGQCLGAVTSDPGELLLQLFPLLRACSGLLACGLCEVQAHALGSQGLVLS